MLMARSYNLAPTPSSLAQPESIVYLPYLSLNLSSDNVLGRRLPMPNLVDGEGGGVGAKKDEGTLSITVVYLVHLRNVISQNIL
jgi:hypothetical protein